MGLYFLYPACKAFKQIHTERNTIYELTASTNRSNLDLSMLMQIEGVERVSPVLILQATLSADDFKLENKVVAVYSSFLDLDFYYGNIYPDASNMPYLILNEAAAKAFSMDGKTMSISLEDTVMLKIDDTERKANICGIFDDGSETPIVYMSYDTAHKEFGRNQAFELVFALKNKGYAESVATALRAQDVDAVFDASVGPSWDLLTQQFLQTMFFSISLLSCFAVLIHERHKKEVQESRFELMMLLISGIARENVEIVYILRIAMLEMICLIATAIFSFFTGMFSLLASVVVVCVSCAYFFVVVSRKIL